MTGAFGPFRLRRGFRSPQPPDSVAEVLERHRTGALRIETLIRVFYAFPLYWYLSNLRQLRPLMSPAEPSFQWPVAWLAWVGADTFAPAVLLFGIGSAAGALFWPEARWVRGLAFLGLLQVLALKFSYGKIHHLMHAWLFTSFLFIGLPDGWWDSGRRPRAVRAASHLVFSAAQAAVALTYSLAGLGKLLGTLYQAVRGEVTPLHPSALARHLADRIQQTDAESLLGPWMIEHGVWLWPMMLATLYLQTFALWAAFRPRLHRLWGVGLVGFHAVTVLSLTIDFNPSVVLLAILFLASPSAPPLTWTDAGRIARDLPLLGGLFQPRADRAALRTAPAHDR